MSVRKFLAVAGLLLALAGCVTQPINTERAATYKRVGVLSAMEDRFSVSGVGVTAFSNSHREDKLDIGADDVMTAGAIQALSARYQLVDLGRYRRAFVDQPKHWPGEKGVFAKDHPMVPEVVRDLMGGEKLDAYILITPGYSSVRGTNQSVAGIGLVRIGSLFGGGDTRLHAAYIVSVIDGTDFSLQADMRAFPAGESLLSSFAPIKSPISAPNVPVPAQFLDAPAKHRDSIAGQFRQMMAENLPQTLRQARLLE